VDIQPPTTNVVIIPSEKEPNYFRLHIDRQVSEADEKMLDEIQGVDFVKITSEYEITFSIGKAFYTEYVLSKVRWAFNK